MIDCYPVIDCAFKYSGWRDTFCCRPPYFDKDTIESIVDTLRTIMQSPKFKSGMEFVYSTKDFTFVGVLKWVDELFGCEDYAYDKVERRLPTMVGISYKSPKDYYFPSLDTLSHIYKIFVSDKYDTLSEKNLDCYISGHLNLSLSHLKAKKQKVVWKKTEGGIQIKPSGYSFLFDDRLYQYITNEELFYINNLPKGIELPHTNLLFSKKGFLSGNTNAIKSINGENNSFFDTDLTFFIDSDIPVDSNVKDTIPAGMMTEGDKREDDTHFILMPSEDSADKVNIGEHGTEPSTTPGYENDPDIK